VRVRGTIQDISERRRTEEELRKSEARLLRAQRIGKAGNWEWEARHNRVIWSREALRIFGLPEDSVRRDSMDWTANIHPDDRNTAISAIEDIRRDGQPRELEYRVVRPDGSIRHVLEQLDARLDAEGKINRISGVVQDVTDHKMTELALRDSEARLRSFIENAPIGMSIKTVKGRYLMVNRLTADLLGDKPETIIGRTAADYWSPDEVRRIEEHEREVRDKGAAVMREMHVRERPGAPWFYELKFPLHDAAGRITAIGGALIDITPQKQAQAALQRARDEARKHEQRLVDAIESLDDAFSLHDSAGRLVKFNDRYRRAFPGLEDMIGIGVTYEETISAMVARGLAPEAKGREAEWIAKRVADHRDGGDRFEFRTADGRWLLISERRTHDGGVVSIRTDITTRKMAEEALRRSEARLRSFLENVPATMTIKDRERRYLSLNTLAAETMGRAADEFHGRRIEDVYSGPGAEVATAMDREALETGKPVAREVHYLPSARFGLSYDVKFPIREGNRVVGIGGIGFDISELKRTEQRLTAAMQRAEAANLAKSQFLANMSHELRTPLNAVIGFSEIMAQEAFGPLGSPRYLDYLKDILASGRHLLEIVDDVLDTARIESGAVELRSEPVDLPALVETCRHMISIAASNKGLTLEAAVDGGLPPVIADGKRLRQCLLNLLSNAVKFTPSGGRIIIAAERGQDGGLCLKVTDTGIGILHDRLPLIFRPFSEVENAYAREHGGAGLGLFLTKSLVEAHGGGITVESMSGEGTTVTISLPTSRWATDQVSPA
jgi:PAS domain S-box-containing protein